MTIRRNVLRMRIIVYKMVGCSRIYKFLSGLNVEFDEIRGRIIGRQVCSEVCREENRSIMLGKKVATPPVETSVLATVVGASRNQTPQKKLDNLMFVATTTYLRDLLEVPL